MISLETITDGIQQLDEEYIKNTIVDGRQKGFMRTAPITALALLRKYSKINSDAKAIFIRVDAYNTQPYSEEDAIKYNIYDVFWLE